MTKFCRHTYKWSACSWFLWRSDQTWVFYFRFTFFFIFGTQYLEKQIWWNFADTSLAQNPIDFYKDWIKSRVLCSIFINFLLFTILFLYLACNISSTDWRILMKFNHIIRLDQFRILLILDYVWDLFCISIFFLLILAFDILRTDLDENLKAHFHMINLETCWS